MDSKHLLNKSRESKLRIFDPETSLLHFFSNGLNLSDSSY